VTTAKKTQRAALFVFLSLLAAVIAGLVLYAVYAGRPETAVPLLIGCVLAAFVLVIGAARITVRHRRSRQLIEAHNVPPRGLLHLLELRQWLILMVGITVIAIGTGALTGIRILADDPETQTTGTTLPAAPTPTPSPVPSEPPTEPAPSPSDSAAPTESVEPTDTGDPTDGTSATPAPGSTQYLDSEEVLDGGYDAKAVSLSATRYPRGIQFYCDTATNTHLQWNVAGNSRFSATAGIDDNTQNAYGKVVEFLFYDQDGHRLLAKPVEVSVGHPSKVALDLTNVVSLRMTCSSRDAKTNNQNNTYAVFGDPIVVHQ
jgi:hypothetical protein